MKPNGSAGSPPSPRVAVVALPRSTYESSRASARLIRRPAVSFHAASVSSKSVFREEILMSVSSRLRTALMSVRATPPAAMPYQLTCANDGSAARLAERANKRCVMLIFMPAMLAEVLVAEEVSGHLRQG